MSYTFKLFIYKKLIKRAKKLKYLYDIVEYEKMSFLYAWYSKILRKVYLYFLKDVFKKFVDHISEISSITEYEINEEKEKKSDLKGKFNNRIYVEMIGVPEKNSDDLNYFRDNPDRYPEISLLMKEALPEKYSFFGCHKLARDNVLSINSVFGNIVFYKILSIKDFKYAVLEKFIEESTELYEAKSRSNIIEEIGDAKEVFDVLKDL